MATVLVNTPFTFQVLFLDVDNIPIVALNPTITIFSFSDLGVKQELVAATVMTPATPVEVGRYTHTYTVPSAFGDGDMIYGEMTGEHPVSGDFLWYSEEVSVVTLPPGSQGLSWNTVKGG